MYNSKKNPKLLYMRQYIIKALQQKHLIIFDHTNSLYHLPYASSDDNCR